MIKGDRVRLHIDPGHSGAIGAPDEIGTIIDVKVSSPGCYVLIHFRNESVYLAPFRPSEVEVVSPHRNGAEAPP